MERGVVPAPERSRLLKALRGVDQADDELRAAVIAAHQAGGSVREIARLAGLSTNTIQRWIKTERA